MNYFQSDKNMIEAFCEYNLKKKIFLMMFINTTLHKLMKINVASWIISTDLKENMFSLL